MTENTEQSAVPAPEAVPEAPAAPAAPAETMAAALTTSGTAISMKQLLEAGVHFGHQTKRWNPKMKPYIFGARNGIYIIDLQKTVGLARSALPLRLATPWPSGGTVLFVGTKKQAQDAVREEAARCGQFFVNNRWLGGTLTNFKTVKQSIERLKTLEKMNEDGTYERLPKKESPPAEREREKLEKNLGGIKEMRQLPGRHLRHRPEEGAHRGPRGQQARHPGGGGGRHQLRPGRDRLRHPRQRRRHPRHPALHRQGGQQ